MKRSTPTFKRLSVLLWFATFSIPLSAHALECASDADCAEGEFCEIWEVPSAPCTIDEEGNEDCEEVESAEEEMIGLCQEQAIECEQDSDCPSHLSCEFVSNRIEPAGEGSASSSGSSGSSEDPEEAPPPLPEEEPGVRIRFVPALHVGPAEDSWSTLLHDARRETNACRILSDSSCCLGPMVDG